MRVRGRFNIVLWEKRNDENQKHANELVSLWFSRQAKKEIKRNCDFVGILKYFLSLEELLTCLLQVHTVVALSEVGC